MELVLKTFAINLNKSKLNFSSGIFAKKTASKKQVIKKVAKKDDFYEKPADCNWHSDWCDQIEF